LPVFRFPYLCPANEPLGFSWRCAWNISGYSIYNAEKQMRNALLTLILLAILAVDTGANPAGFFAGYVGARRLAVLDAWEAAGLNTGLVSYWAMRTNTAANVVTDEYGTNTATAVNSPTFSEANGVRDNGVGLVAASSQSVDVADNASLRITGAMSIAFWVKPSGTPAVAYRFVNKIGAVADNHAGYGSLITGDYKPRFQLATSASAATSFIANSAITTNWTHLAFTYEPSTAVRIYINGTEDIAFTSSIQAGQFSDNTRKLTIGRFDTTASDKQYLNGSIDEVAIWNRALSSNEVYQIYSTPLYAPYKQ